MFTILAKLKAEMRGKNPEWEDFKEKLNKLTADNVDDLGYQFREKLKDAMKKKDYDETNMSEFLQKCLMKLIEKARDEENNSEL